MTYEERVQQIAEEMAAKKYPISFQLYKKYKDKVNPTWHEVFYRDNWSHLVDEFMKYSIIAIKHMAQAFEDGARWSEGWMWSEYELSDQMKDRGLIPPKEGGEDEI